MSRAVFPVVRGAGGGKAVTRAVGAVLSAATGKTILSGRALRRKLRKKPLSSLKKCGEDVASLDDYRWQEHCGGLFQLPVAA